jgi:HK97 gp10 family phage protein
MSGISGLDEIIVKLQGMKEAALAAAEQAMRRELTERTVAEAKMNAPVGATGELRNRISAKAERTGDTVIGKVVSGAEHSIYVEMGTGPVGEAPGGGRPPRPLLYPAFKATQDAVVEGGGRAIGEALKKGGA